MSAAAAPRAPRSWEVHLVPVGWRCPFCETSGGARIESRIVEEVVQRDGEQWAAQPLRVYRGACSRCGACSMAAASPALAAQDWCAITLIRVRDLGTR